MKIIKMLFKIFSGFAKVFAIIAVVNLIFAYIEEFVHREVPDGGKIFVWRHGKVFYHKRGRGAPVILIHGFEPNHSGKDVVSLSRYLATNHTVYSIDLLGFGLSDKPWITYTNYLYVQLIQDFIKEITGDITDIVACGGSGLCALQAYQMDPDLIGKIILVDPCYSEPVQVSTPTAAVLRKIIDLPIIGTFFYNLYSLTGAAPFDKEGRHVFTSILSGYLTSDLTGHEDLINDSVAVLKKDSLNNFTFGDVKSSLV